MSYTFKVTAKSSDFTYAVKLLKKRGGGDFDYATKIWSVSEHVASSLRQYPEYFSECSKPVSELFTEDYSEPTH